MNTIECCTLSFLHNSLCQSHGFLTPVFENNGIFLIQVFNEDLTIKEFREFYRDSDGHRLPIESTYPQSVKKGEIGIFAYAKDSSNVYCDSFLNIKSTLVNLLKEESLSSFSKLEIAYIIGDPQVILTQFKRTFKELWVKNNQIAKSWYSAQMPTKNIERIFDNKSKCISSFYCWNSFFDETR